MITLQGDEMSLGFGRWDSFDACVAEMMLFHDEASAHAIATSIQERIASGNIFKTAKDVDNSMKVIKSSDDEIVVYGPASWAKRDPVGDFVTQEFMVDFFKKWFNDVPEEYRNIMLDHENYQVGVPLLSYEAETGEKLYTHVHEAAPMLLAKIRPDDGLKSTQKFRKDVLRGVYKSYSISWFPVRYETVRDNPEPSKDDLWASEYTNYHYEGDPIETTICRYGMVDAAKFNVIKQRKKELCVDKYERMEKLWDIVFGKPFAGYDDFEDCVRQNSDKEDPDAYCASIMHQVEGKRTTANNISIADVTSHEAVVPLELQLRLRDIFKEALKNVQN
jgi:hypothetical protein